MFLVLCEHYDYNLFSYPVKEEWKEMQNEEKFSYKSVLDSWTTK